MMPEHPLYLQPFLYRFILKRSALFVHLHYYLAVGIWLFCFYLLRNATISAQFLMLIVVALMLTFLHRKNLHAHQNNPDFSALTIDNNGYYYCYQDKKLSDKVKLTKRSRVSRVGCWLCFETQPARFIFKDSLSEADFSQLSRIINAL